MWCPRWLNRLDSADVTYELAEHKRETFVNTFQSSSSTHEGAHPGTTKSMMAHQGDRHEADSRSNTDARAGRIIAVCLSHGGIPKTPRPEAQLAADGFVGDGHEHEKHIRPHRAVLIQDEEKLEELRLEGYALAPGAMGENLTVRGLNVQSLSPGTRLRLENGPLLQLSEPRRPCFVLDQIDPRLQADVVGRCGYLAQVLEEGRAHEGQRIDVISD